MYKEKVSRMKKNQFWAKEKARPVCSLALLVAELLQKSNIYKSFRAIVDFYEFIKSRHPELFEDD
jgi:hypothetical protein